MFENLTLNQITLSIVFLIMMFFILLYIHQLIVNGDLTRTIKGNKVWIDAATDNIKDLQGENEKFKSFNDELLFNRNELLERINKLTSQVKHTKYVPLKKESGKWECLNDILDYFQKGKIYTQDMTIAGGDNIWLFQNDDHLHPYLVSKSDFKAV